LVPDASSVVRWRSKMNSTSKFLFRNMPSVKPHDIESAGSTRL
jgi:hypothetical protein